jgi:trigger factor
LHQAPQWANFWLLVRLIERQPVKTTVTSPNATERVLDLEIPRDRLDKIFQDKVKKYSKEIKVNGFRPGQVPKEVVAARFREPIAAEALETLLENAIREACKENNIEPVAPARVDNLDNAEGKPITAKAIVEIDPPVEPKDYLYNIPLNPGPVDEALVTDRIEDIRRQLGRELEAPRASKIGDVVMARYEKIEVEGQPQELPQHPVFRVELGKGSVPELDKALEGVKKGEVKDVAFNFPADYANPALAGKHSAYTLAIDQVLEVVKPDLDDAFASNIGYENLADLRTRLKARLEESAVREAREKAWDEAINRLLASNPVEVPKARILNYVNHRLKEMGHEHEDHTGHDHSDLEQEAVTQIRRWRLIDAIAAKENVKPAQEDVDVKIQELAMRYGTDFETLKASLRKSGKIVDIREEAKAEKTLGEKNGLFCNNRFKFKQSRGACAACLPQPPTSNF